MERRCRLVEEQPIRALQKSAGEREALLLARREAAIPIVVLVKPVGIFTKPAGGKRLGNLRIAELAGRLGEGDGVTQAADWDIGALRQEKQTLQLRGEDLAGAL